MSRRTVGAIATLGLLALSVVGSFLGVAPKVLGIAWIGFGAMAGGAWLGRRSAGRHRARGLVWGYGLSSGAMLVSASLFLVPDAIAGPPGLGGLGIAGGLVVGYTAHTVGHRLTHVERPFDDLSFRLSAHSLADGAVIGLVYAAAPALGPLLGVAIVSHKGPAGYAAARRLAGEGRPVSTLLFPAAGVGLAAIPTAAAGAPATPWVSSLVLGFAAGVFLHVAMDFLPECEVGGEVHDLAVVEGGSHARLDRLRLHAVASTLVGGAAVVLAWATVGGPI